MKSCMGYIYEVDLTSGTVNKVKVPDEVYYNVLSGKGLAAWYMLRNMPDNADPLGPDNILGITSGALTGSGSLMTGRWMMTAKSPLSGGWGESNGGGYVSPAIKQCGVDGIFFKGVSPKPVYLYLDNKTCEIRDAEPYWGLPADEAEQKLTEAHSDKKKKPVIALIGEAGERLSYMAGVCTDGGRIAARYGLGAVMGSKKLKAIVFQGSGPIQCADPEKMAEYSKELGEMVKSASLPGAVKGGALGVAGKLMGKFPYNYGMDGSMTVGILKKWGTPMNTPMAVNSGDAPLANWAGGPKDVPKIAKAYNPDFTLAREKRKYHCYSCPMGCGGVLDISDINYGEFEKTHKPEYETINAFGPLLKNFDLKSVLYINELLNKAGMDSISAGGTAAFAFECFEHGIIDERDTDGLELLWGNTDALIELVRKIIAREGIGDILADGSKLAADRIGKGSERCAVHVGNVEPGMHDPKNDPALGIHYYADPMPGKHTIGMGLMYGTLSLSDISSWAPPVKVAPKKNDLVVNDELTLAVKSNACYTMVVDAAGGCYYAEMFGAHHWKLIDYLNAASGWNRSGDEYLVVGERIQTMKQLFNVRQGADPTKTKINGRIIGYPALKNGPLKGIKLPELDGQRQDYWRKFGWDENTGIPKEETLEKLGINELLNMEV